jgi:hypothetical protein
VEARAPIVNPVAIVILPVVGTIVVLVILTDIFPP